jgi:hypothetical protein
LQTVGKRSGPDPMKLRVEVSRLWRLQDGDPRDVRLPKGADHSVGRWRAASAVGLSDPVARRDAASLGVAVDGPGYSGTVPGFESASILDGVS